MAQDLISDPGIRIAPDRALPVHDIIGIPRAILMAAL
jgi:hypothetical protein